MKYCGIKRKAANPTLTPMSNKFNRNDEPYQALGDQIISSIEYGSEIGSPAVVQYDPSDTDEVDVMTSPDHDYFDIAEQFGGNVSPAPPADKDDKE